MMLKIKKYVLLQCPIYADLRDSFFNRACHFENSYISMLDDEKLIHMFTMMICNFILPKSAMIYY